MNPIPPLRRCLPFLILAASLQITLGYYDPAAQRWINRDPIGEAGGEDLHAYARNSPVERHDAYGLLPASSEVCKALARKIENIKQDIARMTRELYEDPQELPGKLPGDKNKPSISRRGHQMKLNMAKANLARREAEFAAYCSDPEEPIKQCLLEMGEAIPGTPDQLQQLGEISDTVAEVTQTLILIIEGGGLSGGGVLPSPAPRPTPKPVPSPAPNPFPPLVPAFP